jgi:hypothetical protein
VNPMLRPMEFPQMVFPDKIWPGISVAKITRVHEMCNFGVPCPTLFFFFRKHAYLFVGSNCRWNPHVCGVTPNFWRPKHILFVKTAVFLAKTHVCLKF